MKRKILFWCAMFCVSLNVCSASEQEQDTIITVDKDTIACSIMELADDGVFYTKYGQSVKFFIAKEYVTYMSNQKITAKAHSTILTKGGEVIVCEVLSETDEYVRYKELGKKAEYSLPKAEIISLVRPDGTIVSCQSSQQPKAFQQVDGATPLRGKNESIPSNQKKNRNVNLEESKQNPSRVYYSDLENKLIMNGLPISEEHYMELCNQVDSNLWDMYNKGTKKRRTGLTLGIIGLTGFGLGSILSALSPLTDTGMLIGGVTTMSLGAALAIPGIILTYRGTKYRQSSVNDYNMNIENKNRQGVVLKLGMSDAGIGLALNF